MIRPTKPEDTPELLALASGTEVFKPHEIIALEEVLNDYHQFNQGEGHRAVTYEQQGQIVGFAYFAPRAMTDRTWDLYWIAVTRQTQARGIGTRLLHHIEEAIRGLQGRLLLIETSSLPHYDLTRRFYVKHKYEQAAVIKDFYSDGDDLVIFRKRL
ncbi:MAG: GNAT family N-acetyltransferase [Planctomycetes bacterium]|nr:GNAT family N-acetyltransferase [Planctomycetota bacterium]